MDLGKNIMKLRKNNNLTQEELSELVGVSRQTISKWELGETAPDIKEAKILSNIFHISLDELVDNDVNNIIVEKVSNTEKLAGMIIKILKFMGFIIIGFIIFIIIAFILVISNRKVDHTIYGTTNMICELNGEEYRYEFRYNKNFQILENGGDAFIVNHTDLEKYDDVNKAVAHIDDWFNEHNGTCTIDEAIE